MKILLLCGWFYPDSVGGTEVYVSMLAIDLSRMGHQVTVAAPARDGNEETYKHNGITVFRYPINTHPPKSEIAGEVPPTFFGRFTAWVRDQQFDVVHQHTFNRECGYFHAEYFKQLGIPLVFTAHVPEIVCARGTLMRWGTISCDGQFRAVRCTACVLQKKGVPRFASIAMSRFLPSGPRPLFQSESRISTLVRMKALVIIQQARIRATLQRADAVVSVANWLAQMITGNGTSAEKVIVSRHGLAVESSSRQSGSTSAGSGKVLRIGFVGRLDPIKGLHVLIAAARRIGGSTNVEFHIYGRANDAVGHRYEDRLKKAAAQCRNIIFAGEVTSTNRLDIMNRLDVLAVPSLWFETGPFVVLEAFAAGIPVIGSKIGGIAENVIDGVNGILVTPGSVKQLAGAIRSLMDEPSRLQDLRRGIPPVRSSWDVAREMASLYEQVISRPKLVNWKAE